MVHVTTQARRASRGPWMSRLAKGGLAARAVIYLVMGWLAIEIAAGHHTQQANQKGALATIAARPFGEALLWLLGLGFAAYALWRLSEAAFGTAAEGDKTGPRLQSAGRAIAYGALSVTTFAFVLGVRGRGQAQQQETATGTLMKHTYGRWLVGLVGLVIVVVGLAMVYEGLTRAFEKDLKMHELHGRTRTVVLSLGAVGTVARGVVFAVAGVLVVQAAVSYDVKKSTGLDGALRTLANRPYGSVILGVVALGLIAFGLYGLACTKWAKT